MGIDGWIYIAVGDFGFHNAVDRDGTTLTQLGGGIVRVRPDGTEMEVYTHGLRNIYDVAIDPYMNIFTRGNTNDGGGWNVRFADQIQSAEYGYPMLFKHFTEDASLEEDVRVAAVYTYAQMAGAQSIGNLIKLSQEAGMEEQIFSYLNGVKPVTMFRMEG